MCNFALPCTISLLDRRKLVMDLQNWQQYFDQCGCIQDGHARQDARTHISSPNHWQASPDLVSSSIIPRDYYCLKRKLQGSKLKNTAYAATVNNTQLTYDSGYQF